jgi:hypothetical protein
MAKNKDTLLAHTVHKLKFKYANAEHTLNSEQSYAQAQYMIYAPIVQ